ncbi:MAG: SDR family oxidoreductase [Rhodospirillaceae bacterium]|nr:SDR family oxidoreductase [Rhodospirillaceae bacterium]
MKYKGKVALITAGGRGIGQAVAEELAKGGAAIALNDVEEARLTEAASHLRRHGPKVTTHPGSVMDEAFVKKMVADAVAEHGKIDLLLNNAGGAPPGAAWGEFTKLSLDDIRGFMELNFFSQVMVLKAVLPGMLDRGYGKVVCVSSISAVLGQEGGSHYAAGKMALHALVSSVGKEVARKGVNINGVILGNPPHPSRTKERQNYLDKMSHMDRVGDFAEFGKALSFLLSDDASYMSGTMMTVDGGLVAPRLNE